MLKSSRVTEEQSIRTMVWDVFEEHFLGVVKKPEKLSPPEKSLPL